MRLDSVRSLKAQVSAEVRASHGDGVDARAFFASTEPPMPFGVALGVGLRDDGEHVLVVRAESAQMAEPYAALAKGEADVRILRVVGPRPPPVTAQTTPTYYQAQRRPLEPGCQVQMVGKNFVGTGGCFVKDAHGILYFLSNSHVLADEGRASPGHIIGQPWGDSPIGVLTRFVPMSGTVPNLVDAAIARLNPAIGAVLGWTSAINGAIRGVRAVVPEDLGREVAKVGRTTGAQRGRITAVEVDGLPVAYDSGVIRFNDQVEVSGGIATDFSAGGDSGSLIVTADGDAIALLFAGGRDSTGQDQTYANRLSVVLEQLGVTLA